MKYEDFIKYQKDSQRETKMSNRKEHCIIVHVHVNSTKEEATALGHALGVAANDVGRDNPIHITDVDVLVGEAKDQEKEKNPLEGFMDEVALALLGGAVKDWLDD